MKKYHLAPYKNGGQDLLHSRRLRTEEGRKIRHITWYGILYHPACPPSHHHNTRTFYRFAPWSEQDKILEGLLRIDVKDIGQIAVTHYLSIDSIGEIVKSPFL